MTQTDDTMPWVPCPVCCDDRTENGFVKNGYSIVTCCGCGLRYVNPRPRPDQLAEFYRREYVAGVPSDAPGSPDDLHGPMKRATARLRLDLIREFRGSEFLLDVGCGGGFFVQAAREAGWRAVGMDVALAGLSRVPGGSTWCLMAHAEQTPFRNGQFNVMTAYDVLEHLVSPRTFLIEAHRLLAPGGVLLIETPNMAGWMPWLLRSRHPCFRPPDHLTYFTASALRSLLEQTGFRIERLQTSAEKVLTPAYVFGLTATTNPIMTAIGKVLLKSCSSIWERSYKVQMDTLIAVARV